MIGGTWGVGLGARRRGRGLQSRKKSPAGGKIRIREVGGGVRNEKRPMKGKETTISLNRGSEIITTSVSAIRRGRREPDPSETEAEGKNLLHSISLLRATLVGGGGKRTKSQLKESVMGSNSSEGKREYKKSGGAQHTKGSETESAWGRNKRREASRGELRPQRKEKGSEFQDEGRSARGRNSGSDPRPSISSERVEEERINVAYREEGKSQVFNVGDKTPLENHASYVVQARQMRGKVKSRPKGASHK